MKNVTYISVFSILFLQCIFQQTQAQPNKSWKQEPHRPQIHFTPKAHWMNDPNGMVYYKGLYHLFFQYYPDSTVWGPMHWGHANSKDLIHWKELPIALYPDSLGYIFSGSIIVDKNNTSGFGENGEPPMVAIFTHHNMAGEKAGVTDFQNQSIAYSIDGGNTWVKYANNPVVKNPGIKDFRDPKVIWYEPQKKWIMTLATKDRITFYSSPNLKDWTKESEFGSNLGAHDGVWECPDLFTLKDGTKDVWVLTVSINPGGPNGGSATQYFTGAFNGHIFTTKQVSTKWIDYGTDNYAGVTWSNTGNRSIFLGWMSNWQYATVVPTKKWRSAMTIPRELTLQHVGTDLIVASKPVAELATIQQKPVVVKNILLDKEVDLASKVGAVTMPCRIECSIEQAKDFSMVIANTLGEELVIGYKQATKQFFINRKKSGKVDFEKGFAAIHTAPRLSNATNINISIILDVSSVELFADNGLTAMTDIFFPTKTFTKIKFKASKDLVVTALTYRSLRSSL